MLVAVIIFAVLAPVTSAHAATPDSLLKKVVDKLAKTKSITVYNEIDEEINQPKKEKPKKAGPAREKRKREPELPDRKEIEKQAEFASQVTGVRKDFLMGMLVVESALGQNTGECTYQEVKDGAEEAHKNGQLSTQAWQTFLERKKIIQDIADSLGYDAEKLRVSCNPAYAGTGGAMGIPQFMPDTWMEYKDKISAIVGTDNPDPWNVRDGVLAMALKVADVPGVVEHNVWAERNASKLYLSGTTSWQYDWYASDIQYWANNYEKLIG